jgi:hypothetical protein
LQTIYCKKPPIGFNRKNHVYPALHQGKINAVHCRKILHV